MDIVAKHTPRFALLFEQRSAGKSNLHGVLVSFEQVGQETTLRIVTTMRFVDEEDALKIGAITVVHLYLRLVLLELLDVHHHYFQFSLAVGGDSATGDVSHQFRATLGIMHDKPTGGKLIGGLLHEVDAVNNEVELRHHIAFGKEISQTANTVISESRLAAALRVPDDTALDSFFQSTTNGIRSEHLLITHDVLLQRSALRAVFQLHFALHISNAVAKQEQETLLAEHRRNDAIGGRVYILVGLVFFQILDDHTVAVLQHLVFRFIREFAIRIIRNKGLVFFTEDIEERLIL